MRISDWSSDVCSSDLLAEALRGSEISAHDRIKIFRQISERFLTQWGTRHEMFEKFNGTPLYLVNMLTVQRTEYQVDGPLTELAREVLGFGDKIGRAHV